MLYFPCQNPVQAKPTTTYAEEGPEKLLRLSKHSADFKERYK